MYVTGDMLLNPKGLTFNFLEALSGPQCPGVQSGLASWWFGNSQLEHSDLMTEYFPPQPITISSNTIKAWTAELDDGCSTALIVLIKNAAF